MIQVADDVHFIPTVSVCLFLAPEAFPSIRRMDNLMTARLTATSEAANLFFLCDKCETRVVRQLFDSFFFDFDVTAA